MGKTVFITVGTTQFDELIHTVLRPTFLQMLSSKNYEHLILQTGRSNIRPDCTPRHGISSIKTFTLSPSIKEYIDSADLVICHAGAGTVLEALDSHKYVVAVLNLNLMANHQTELAEELYKEGYLYFCTCSELLHTVRSKSPFLLRPYIDSRSEMIANYIDKRMGFRYLIPEQFSQFVQNTAEPANFQ